MPKRDGDVGFDAYTVEVAAITAAHGVRGEVKAQCRSDIPDRLQQLDTVVVRPRSGQSFVTRLTRARQIPHKNIFILQLDGVGDRNRAEELIGGAILVDAATSPPLPDDTYYVRDIIGARVVTDEGRELGVLADVLYTGANDVYVTDRGHLLPATDEVIAEIDTGQRLIKVRPLPGMLD